MSRKCVTGCMVFLPLQPKDMSSLKDAQLCVAMQLFGLIVKLIFGDRVRVQFPRVYWNIKIMSVTKPFIILMTKLTFPPIDSPPNPTLSTSSNSQLLSESSLTSYLTKSKFQAAVDFVCHQEVS